MKELNEAQYLENQFNELLKNERISIDSKRSWLEQIENKPGVYIIEIKKKIAYVGETGNLKKRMKDLLRTNNHTFRRSLGKLIFNKDENYSKASSTKKFNEIIEKKLDVWMYENCKVSFLTTKIGRKELEELIQDEYGSQLLNVRRKRK
ncbi:MAG: GIY-YIG nuclease family protein [Saprospiraceae bacterium]